MSYVPWALAALFAFAYAVTRRHKRILWACNRHLSGMADALAREIGQLKQTIENKDAKIRALEVGIKVMRREAQSS